MTSTEDRTLVHFIETWSWLRVHPHDSRAVNLTTSTPSDVTCPHCRELLPADLDSTHLVDGRGGPECFPDYFARQLSSGIFGNVWGRHPFRDALSSPGAARTTGDLESVDCPACLTSVSYGRTLPYISSCGCDRTRAGCGPLGHRIHFQFPSGGRCGNYPTQVGPLRMSWDGLARDRRGRTSRAQHETSATSEVTCLHCLDRLSPVRDLSFGMELVA